MRSGGFGLASGLAMRSGGLQAIVETLRSGLRGKGPLAGQLSLELEIWARGAEMAAERELGLEAEKGLRPKS